MQLGLGYFKAGAISNYFPNNVIEGMLAGIGIIIFLKQIPKALGSDVEVGSGLRIFTDLYTAFTEIQFLVTVLVIVFADLLTGVALGMFMSIFAVLRGNMKRAYYFRKEEYEEGDIIHIHLAQEVSFLNKAAILFTLDKLPENSKVIINASDTVYIAHDILDSIMEFRDVRAPIRKIDLTLIGFKKEYDLKNTETDIRKVSIEHNLLMHHRDRHKTSREVITEIKNVDLNTKTNKNNQFKKIILCQIFINKS